MYKTILIFVLPFLFIPAACNSQQEKESLDAKAFYEKLKSEPEAIILDVRTPGEFHEGALQSAVNVDYNSGHFEAEAGKMDKTKTYFVYCLAGGRSSSAAGWMRKSGFQHVYDLKGGMMAWQKEGLPLNVAREKMAKDKISTEDYARMTGGDVPVLVDFYAPWCGPCKKMEPMLKELSSAHEGKLKVLRINIDENKKLAGELGVLEIPVLKLYKNGKETWQKKGLTGRKEIEDGLKL
jgi:thioredoxin